MHEICCSRWGACIHSLSPYGKGMNGESAAGGFNLSERNLLSLRRHCAAMTEGGSAGLDPSQGVGIFLQVIGQRTDRLKGSARDVVLHAFNVSVDGIFIDIKEFEEAGQGLVAVNDGTGDACAFLGEGGATVFDMGDKAFGIKLLEHVGNAGLRDLQSFRNVDGAGVALFLNEVEDLLEVVIAGGRAAGTVTGAGSIGHDQGD